MSWRPFSKFVNRMASSMQGGWWHTWHRSRANKWIAAHPDATRVILEHYAAGGEVYAYGKVPDRDRAHHAINYIWRGQLLTPGDWSDERVATAAGRIGDWQMVNLDSLRMVGVYDGSSRDEGTSQVRRTIILRAYLEGLQSADRKYQFHSLAEQAARIINDGYGRGETETLLGVLGDMAQDSVTKAFHDASIQMFTGTQLKKLGASDSAALVGIGLRRIEENEVKSKAEKAEYEYRRASCAAGQHNWGAAGLVHYYSSGRMYKTEVMKEQVCRWCGRKK